MAISGTGILNNYHVNYSLNSIQGLYRVQGLGYRVWGLGDELLEGGDSMGGLLRGY